MNFFAQQLYDYYLEGGKQLPPGVLAVLGKPVSGLDDADIDIYNRFVGPYQDKIRSALRDRYIQQGSPMHAWSQQVNPYYRPIVEELAAQIMGMESAPRFPEMLVARTAHIQPGTERKGSRRRPNMPHISYRLVVVVLAVVALLAGGGWLYFSATAPSRMLKGIKGELARGEYALALRHIEEIGDKYPERAQAEEAEGLRPQAALNYARELQESALYEEAIHHYELAEAGGGIRGEAARGRADTYLAWAAVLNGNGEHTKSYECCDSALFCAPPGYDTVPVMDLRAQVLFSWGESLRNQGDFLGAAERYEKCYREWPAGSLANKALESYIDMTVADCCGAAPPSKSPTAGGSVKVILINPTGYGWKCFLSGPSTICIDLAPHETKTIYILPGIYNDVCIIESLMIYCSTTGDDFSRPTGSYSWWEITIPFPEEVAPQGVAYAQIMARIDELEAQLPPEILDCVEELVYRPMDSGGHAGDSMAEYSPSENTIYFDAAFIAPEDLDGAIFHEWGHAFSDFNLDAEEKAAYMEMRDINSDIPWDNMDNYYLSVEEDFAEVFAVVFGNIPWTDYTWYGPVADAEGLKELIITTAD
ncbi:MAG: tetratricopeptide repeat protein [Actinobacteria bacterium]|jgi:tetratricopeptide (TPR) repeat protein|nr:MAG: tetratricopeptide repeat protein [Actinomycetota bacterium]